MGHNFVFSYSKLYPKHDFQRRAVRTLVCFSGIQSRANQSRTLRLTRCNKKASYAVIKITKNWAIAYRSSFLFSNRMNDISLFSRTDPTSSNQLSLNQNSLASSRGKPMKAFIHALFTTAAIVVLYGPSGAIAQEVSACVGKTGESTICHQTETTSKNTTLSGGAPSQPEESDRATATIQTTGIPAPSGNHHPIRERWGSRGIWLAPVSSPVR